MKNKLFNKIGILFITFALVISSISASLAKTTKLVIDLSHEDSNVWKSAIVHCNNVMKAKPNTQIELVCHSKGIFFALSTNILFIEKIDDLLKKGVKIVACNNTMHRFNIKAEDLHPGITVVKSGVLELAERQNNGWAYYKE